MKNLLIYNRDFENEVFKKNISLCFNLRFILICMLIISISLMILIPGVNALGITPGRTTLNYEPGLEKEIIFSVLNSEEKPLKIQFSIEGELKNYITLANNSTEFSALDYSKDFKYNIKLPESIAKNPGLHTAEIVALEIPGESLQGTYVGATVAVVSQLYVYVPCPGKCINADLNVQGTDLQGITTLIVPVINRGEQKIDETKAKIEIYSLAGEKLDEIETSSASIEPEKRTELNAKWKAVSEGEYIGKVTVFYDREFIKFEKKFTVGEEILNIERIWVNEFRLGEIAKLRILVENKWNKDLNNVFSTLIVYDNRNAEMANVKSASEDIPSLTEKELITYWDTAGVEEGEYNGKLIVIAEEKSTDKNLFLKVRKDSLDISGVGFAINPEGGEGTSLTTILIILVILLLIGNLAWFVFFKRMRKKKK